MRQGVPLGWIEFPGQDCPALPGKGSPAAQLPKGTIDHLLTRLGYLSTYGSAARSAAIRAFEADRGLAVTGAPSLALMNHLLIAAR